jgi:hypothetical protein
MKNRCDSTSTSSHSGKSSYPLLFSFSDIVWGKKIGKHVINIFLFISILIDKSHRSSQHSVSSGFHSENSSTQNQQQSNKDKTSSNRRPSYSRTNADASVITSKVEEEPAVETESSAKRFVL